MKAFVSMGTTMETDDIETSVSVVAIVNRSDVAVNEHKHGVSLVGNRFRNNCIGYIVVSGT